MSHNKERSVYMTKSIATNSKLLISCDGFSGINVCKITLCKTIGPNRWPDEMRNICNNPFGPIILSYTQRVWPDIQYDLYQGARIKYVST